MKTIISLIVYFNVLLFISCNNADSTKAEKSNKDAPQQPTVASEVRIRNNIKLDTKGVKVSQAFLLYEDGKLVPENNETSVGEPLKLRLVIDGGWQQKEGKVSLGASERIETSDGKLVLDEKDLFENMTVDAEDAKLLSLTAVISRLDMLYDYFLVSFRVWDKYGTGEIKGSYKLYIKAS
jgi:hypothetical protein